MMRMPPRTHPIRRLFGLLSCLVVIAGLANVTVLTGAAQAAIDPGSTAQQIADAINSTGGAVTGSFQTKPPSGTPNAVSDSSLTSFPTDGSNYGILTTGDANLADDSNDSGSSGASDDGPNVRGNTDFDVSILKVDLDVPSGFTCLRVDFRFLSEEFPEFVGSQFNDAFIAELDTSDWTTNGSAITANHNFAFDPDGNPITINSTGFTHMTASEASGTTYDGATPILVAQTPITSGSHSVYLSIFDQGDHYYDSAIFLDNLSLGTQVGPECQPGAQPLSNLSLSVSPGTAPAGFSAMPKSTINYATLTVPGSAGASSLTTSPITHGPITHGPITHGPITHGPITHGPITHGPITHGAIVNADPVYRTASLDQLPLYASVPPILIATVPIASPPPAGNGPGPWSDALAPDTNLASLPFQTITLQQVANSSGVAANISVGDLDLSSTILANLSPAALLFSNATFSQLGLTPPPGFSSSDHPADVELEGKSLASVNFNSLTLADKAMALSSSLISGTSLSGIEWETTTNGWNQSVSNLSAAAQAAVLDCPPGGCGTETLGDARNAGHLKPLADLGDLLQNDPSTFSGKTFGQLLPGLFNVGSFPFEDASLSQVLDAAAIDPASLVTYTAGADVPCPVPGDSAIFSATLPGHGFRYAPGTSSVKFGAESPAPLPDPSMSGNDLTWRSLTNAETCGEQGSGTKHVEIGYKVEPGPEVGTFASSLHVTAGTTLSILDQAPETTTGNFESNNTPGSAQTITRDTLYTDTLQPGTDIDYFNIPVDPSDVGRTIQVSLSHMPTAMDYDLVLYGFAESSTLRGAPITHGPITHGPITHGPLADDAQCGPPGTVLEPQTLQDVPQVNSTDYAIRSYSTNRSTANEFSCTVIQPADVGHGITVQLSTFNAGTSPVPAVLSVEESDPTTPLQCVSVPTAPGDPGPDLPAPGSLLPGTQTLFLVNAEGIGRFYNPADPSAEANVISAITDSSFLSMPNVQGAVLSVDRDEGVAAALSAWYDDYCSPEAANNVVRAINSLVDTYRMDPDTGANRLPNLRNIVLAGSDAVLPFARIQELVNLGSESTEAPNVQFNDMDNPTSRALSLGYMLSDDPYYSFQAIPWLTTELYPPTVAGGRLVETSADIVNAIDQYKAFNGKLDPKTEFTTGYDFFLDSAQAKDDVLHKNYPYPKSGSPPTERASLLNNSWDKSELSAGLDAQPGFAVIDAHADHYRLAPAKAFTGGSVSPSDLYQTNDLAASNLADGTLAFSIGCHAGLSVADVWVSGADPTTLDWAQAFAQKKSVFNGNTGYGYGDSDVIAYTEKLTLNLTENLGMRLSPPKDGGTMSIGQAIALAKQQYYAGLGSWGVFDSKAVEQFTPYGLPMYVIGPDGEVAEPSVPTPDHALDPEPDPDTGLRTSTFQLSTLHAEDPTPGQGGTQYYKGPTGLTQAEHYRPIEP
ncbi:MAG TPA: choice-of-anchor L domain-containing protein, partial [Actinomycetota bacterium]